jgi:putative transposase
VVQTTKTRSGWPARRTLAALGVSATSYYRWLRDRGGKEAGGAAPPRPVQAYEALPAEKAAVKEYALKHPELRHRELAWRMVDEDVAHLSASTVYRILKESNLVSPWRRRSKRRREDAERAQLADERWATDLMYLRVGGGQYYFVAFILGIWCIGSCSRT